VQILVCVLKLEMMEVVWGDRVEVVKMRKRRVSSVGGDVAGVEGMNGVGGRCSEYRACCLVYWFLQYV
jgi:hypothetical protein